MIILKGSCPEVSPSLNRYQPSYIPTQSREASISLSTTVLTLESSTAFDEVAARDVEWGYKSIGWRTMADQNQHKQGYVGLVPFQPCTAALY